MPYSSTKDLPDWVKKMPSQAQKIFMSAFNASFKKHGEAKAFKIATAAVKNKFMKKKGKWVKKSFDEDTKSIDAGIVVGKEHEHHYETRTLPLSRVVEARKDFVDGSSATWVKTKFNTHHPDFEIAKGSIEDNYLTHYSIEFIADPDKTVDVNIDDIGPIRMLDGFDWTGLTFTGKPINTDARITNYYSDDEGNFYTEGYAMVETIDRVGDLISEEAIDYSVRQANEALGTKSDATQIEIKLELEQTKSDEKVKEEITMTEEEKPAEEPKKEEPVEEKPKVVETPQEKAKEPATEAVEKPAEKVPIEETTAEAPKTEPVEDGKSEEMESVLKRLDELEAIKAVKEDVKAEEPEKKAVVNAEEEKFKKKEEAKSMKDIISSRLLGGN